MGKIFLITLMMIGFGCSFAQITAYNPFTQNIHFTPAPTVQGFSCGSVQTVAFTMGLTTANDATQWQTQPLTVTICKTGFIFNGPASNIVSGTYASNFDWSFDSFQPNCIIGTQNQTLFGTGPNPLFPNPLSSGDIKILLKVPETSPINTVLGVNVNLQVPGYMQAFNSVPDDNESTQTQTFCTLKISGNVYHDTDTSGINLNNVNGSPISTPSGTQLYTNLVNVSGNVVASTLVLSNGIYEFLNVTPNTTYTVQLSINQGIVGMPSPALELPTLWQYTGEDCCDQFGNDGLPNGIIVVNVINFTRINVDFGINSSPNVQATITAAYVTNTVNFSTGLTYITFAIRNNNSFPVTLTNLSTIEVNLYENNEYTLWYSTTSLSGIPTITSPVWSIAATSIKSFTPLSIGQVNPFDCIGLVIPPLTTYRFALMGTKGTAARGGVMPNIFSGDGVDLLVGNNSSTGGTVGYFGLQYTGINYSPHYFDGSITFATSTTYTDLQVSSIVKPTSVCSSTSGSIMAKVCNKSPGTFNFLGSPINVAFAVTGPISQTATIPLSSGSLPPCGCINVALGGVDFSAPGKYNLSAIASIIGGPLLDANTANNSVLDSIINYKPSVTPTIDSICQYTNGTLWNGFTGSGCLSQVRTVTVNALVSSPPPADGSSDATATLFAQGSLPALPPGAVITGGKLFINNLNALATGTLGNEARFSIYSPTGGPAVTFVPGTTGSPLSFSVINFDYSINIDAAKLNTMYASLGVGGTFNVGYWESLDNAAVVSDVALNAQTLTTQVQLIIYYTLTPQVKWYTNPVGGTSFYTGSIMNPLTIPGSGITNTNIPGTYIFYASCNADTLCRVPVILKINPVISILPSSTTSICSGAATTLTASGASTYTWQPGSLSGNPITVSPTATTTYTVTGSNAFGCTNDSTITINVSSSLALSNTSTFPNTLASPLQGSPDDEYHFEVEYFDSNNVMPAYNYPRVILDYEGNGDFNNSNDRTLVMQALDVTDTITSDGKKYNASISSLPAGSNWKTHVICNNNSCTVTTPSYNYPDILQESDLEIFANDINFSNPHPDTSSQLTVSATIHNESDSAAHNFSVHLVNQNFSTTYYQDILVPYLGPHDATTVSWNITTPNTAAWCPMEVTVDNTNQINETNELDNKAIRPFLNGNLPVSAGIQVSAYTSPIVSYVTNTYITVGGHAQYYGLASSASNTNVTGAQVSFTVLETGASYTTTTNSSGHFSMTIVQPSWAGIYHIIGTVTDFTLTGSFAPNSFQVIPNPQIITSVNNPPICVLPNLELSLSSSANTIIEGSTITGIVTVKNIGAATSPPTTMYIANSTGISQPLYINVPQLASQAQFSHPYSYTFNTAGFFYITSMVDTGYQINECSKYDNFYARQIHVLPALPDIVPASGPKANPVYNCEISSVTFKLINQGGLATGPFNCTIAIIRNGILVNNITHPISNIPSALNIPNNKISFSIPFTPLQTGNYTFELFCDSPSNVMEVNESNNSALYGFPVLQCKPNLAFTSCEGISVESFNGDYSPGSTIILNGKLINTGNFAYAGNVSIRYQLSNGTIYNDIQFVNLPINGIITVSKNILVPNISNLNVVITIDYNNLIDELKETDNTIQDNVCWEYEPTDHCGNNFWNVVYQKNQSTYLTVGIKASHLYQADTLKINFQVKPPNSSGFITLGNTFLYNVIQNCNCPLVTTFPSNFIFNDTGSYTFKITVDPENKYSECNESNNILLKTVIVTDKPDLRILSQYIAPSLLNPQMGQNINMTISYENIGRSNQTESMALNIFIDDTLFATVNPVFGLKTGHDTTLSIPSLYSTNTPGMHVIKAKIDANAQVDESNELNNEATRLLIVGQSANLHFKLFTANQLYPNVNDSILIKAKIGNNGDLATNADVHFFYVDNSMDTIYITTESIHVDAFDSITISLPWKVLDNKSTIIAKIINSSILEFNYSDNKASFKIGAMLVFINTVHPCNGDTLGELTVNIIGGEPPYSYHWSNGYIGQTLIATVGTYSLTVVDITGQTVECIGSIASCPDVILSTRLFLEGYYTGFGYMAPALFNQGRAAICSYTDSVTIQLREAFSPYTIAQSYKSILQMNGLIESYFASSAIGNSYYIVVKHRNSVEIWSSIPVQMDSSVMYNFTTAASKAYGANQIEVESGIWAMFSGDINQDQAVDAFDYILLDPDIIIGASGYLSTDLNGDGSVDAFDYILLDANLIIGVGAITP